MFCKLILAASCVCFLLIKWGFGNPFFFFANKSFYRIILSHGPPKIHEFHKIPTDRPTLDGEFVAMVCIVSGLSKPHVT